MTAPLRALINQITRLFSRRQRLVSLQLGRKNRISIWLPAKYRRERMRLKSITGAAFVVAVYPADKASKAVLGPPSLRTGVRASSRGDHDLTWPASVRRTGCSYWRIDVEVRSPGDQRDQQLLQVQLY